MKHLLLIFIFLLVCVMAVEAQNTSTDEPSALLPDINPQDIEIRGEFRARFPGITRQPILGFNPTPRVFRLDPNRMPFLETPEQVVASVPLSSLEAEIGPQRIVTQHPEKSYVFGYTGFGMFTSPEAELYAVTKMSPTTSVSSSLNWHSSEGHLIDEAGSNGAFRRANGTVTLNHSFTQNGQLGVQLRGRSDFSDMVRFHPERNNRTELHSGGIGLNWLNMKSAFDVFSLHASADYTLAQKSFNPSTTPVTFPIVIPLEEQNSEWAFNLGGMKSWTGNRIGTIFSVETDHQFGLYDFEGRDKNWFVSSISGFWKRNISNGSQLTIGAKAFSGFDEISDMVFRVYPHIEYRFTTTGGLRLGGVFSGELRNHGLQNAYLQNRGLINQGLIANEQRIYTDIHAEMDLGNVATVHAHFHASYTIRPRMFTAFGTVVHPKELILLRPGAGISVHVAPGLLTVYGDAYLNLSDLNDTNFNEFQHLERFRITGGLRSTPAEHLTVTTWVDLVGPRKLQDIPSGNLPSPDTGSFILLNAQAEYRINGQIGVYVKAMNLLGQQYEWWPFYEERPLNIYGGITFKF